MTMSPQEEVPESVSLSTLMASVRRGAGDSAPQFASGTTYLAGEAAMGRRHALRAKSKATTRTLLSALAVVMVAVFLRGWVYKQGPATDIRRAMTAEAPRDIELSMNLWNCKTLGKGDDRADPVLAPLTRLRVQKNQMEARNPQGLRPELYRLPGYPAWIAFWQGRTSQLQSVLAAQAALGGLIALLVFGLGLKLLKNTDAALLAALVAALHPADIAATNLFTDSTLTVAILLLGLWLTVAGRGHPILALPSGLMVGLAALVQPWCVLAGPLIAAWMLFFGGEKKSRWAAVALLAGSMIAPGWWMYRNHEVSPGWRLSTQSTIDGYFRTAAAIDIASHDGDYDKELPAKIKQQFNSLVARMETDENVMDAMDRLAGEARREHLGLYLQLKLRSMGRVLMDQSMLTMTTLLGRAYVPVDVASRVLRGNLSLDDVGDRSAYLLTAGWLAWNLLLVVLSVVGAAMLAMRKEWATLVLLAGLSVGMLLATSIPGNELAKLPMLGLQALLAAACMVKREKAEEA
ncbi:MAG: hypothetical protein IT440_14275 [Phycisphaeraceae bacterium]|nr:hypothetical protein [Phycisphaeraceae bacterium]